MTWHWDVAGDDLSMWDHTKDPSDAPYQTLTNEKGWSWTGEFPDEVLDAMHDEAQTAIQSGDVQRAVAITLDMAGEQIERIDQS